MPSLAGRSSWNGRVVLLAAERARPSAIVPSSLGRRSASTHPGDAQYRGDHYGAGERSALIDDRVPRFRRTDDDSLAHGLLLTTARHGESDVVARTLARRLARLLSRQTPQRPVRQDAFYSIINRDGPYPVDRYRRQTHHREHARGETVQQKMAPGWGWTTCCSAALYGGSQQMARRELLSWIP
jgi:hypothetical protein